MIFSSSFWVLIIFGLVEVAGWLAGTKLAEISSKREQKKLLQLQ
jgi:hypothetical protein